MATTKRNKQARELLSTGLARREERLARLVQHAEELESLRLKTDAHGRLTHAKEWRETLADIAAETGGRKPQPDSGEPAIKIYAGFDPEKV